MARKITRTWWGERFLEALQRNMDSGRLSRGRAYSSPTRMLEFDIDGQLIKSRIRGNVNPYYGVYEEPRYEVSIQLRTIDQTRWKAIINELSGNAAWLSRLMMNEMPDTIEQAFSKHRAHLLPGSGAELVTQCSCPDWANPCKHIAGTYYRVASQLDREPFLLFQLRGMEWKTLHQILAESPLGKALLTQLTQPEDIALEVVENRYSQPRVQPVDEVTLKAFWKGAQSLPMQDTNPQQAHVAAALIRKQGDYPPFWDRDNSFVEAMKAVYAQVTMKNKTKL